MTFMTVDTARAEMAYREDSMRRSWGHGRRRTVSFPGRRLAATRHRLSSLHLHHA